MPRPRIHHTLEEKKAANRLKSTRYYQRNKDVINFRRRTRQRMPDSRDDQTGATRPLKQEELEENHPSDFSLLRTQRSILNQDDDEDKPSVQTEPFWLSKLRSIERKIITQLEQYNAKTHDDFLLAVYNHHIHDRQNDLLLRTWGAFERISRVLNGLADVVLNAYGIGEEYYRVRDLEHQVEEFYVGNLARMVCQDLFGVKRLVESYDGMQLFTLE